MAEERTEGWTWIRNSPKWHYFRDGRSLCGKYGLFTMMNGKLEDDKVGSPDNCKMCETKRATERIKALKQKADAQFPKSESFNWQHQ